MKIVGVDNLARETVRDQLLAEDVPEVAAEAIVAKLNSLSQLGDGPGTYWTVKPDSYVLWRGMEELV